VSLPAAGRPQIYRLVLWNIDLTLVDVARVVRDACAEAFRQVTGQPLVALPQMAGRTDSEVFFESLALNPAASGPGRAWPDTPDAEIAADTELLARYLSALAAAFGARRELLPRNGRLLPGAAEAVAAVAGLPGAVQSVLTGTIRPNAAQKLAAFGLQQYFDLDIGGYASEVYPKGAELLRSRGRAAQKYHAEFGEQVTVYLADSGRDVEAARMGGARCIAVASGRASAGELREAGADLVLGDLTDTRAVVSAVDRLTTVVAAR
jgi:phosphoglycolate phosphatase